MQLNYNSVGSISFFRIDLIFAKKHADVSSCDFNTKKKKGLNGLSRNENSRSFRSKERHSS